MPQEGLPGQAWLTPEVLSQVPSQPMPQQGLPQPVNQPLPQQPVPQQPVPQRAPQPVPGQRAPKGVPGQPKYSKADVTKAMDQRKNQILEEAKKAKPTRTAPTHSKGAR
jgi:C. briggsae CBR-PQN-26 protein